LLEAIDFHLHLINIEWLSEDIRPTFENLNPFLFNNISIVSSASNLCNYLKGEGIKYAVFLMSYHDLIPLNEVSNEFLYKFCKGYDMLIPFLSIEPWAINMSGRRGEDVLERFVKDMNFKGLKLHPPTGFFPNEEYLYPLYRKAEELNIPVMFHIGSSIFPNMKLKYCDPIYLEDLAIDFPDLTIIMAHGGRGIYYNKAFLMAKLHDNIYIDISGLPPINLLKYFPDLEEISDKVLFGSDWPSIPKGIKENLKVILSLPLKDSTIEKILFKNAERLINKHGLI